jgi:hypothetical protein
MLPLIYPVVAGLAGIAYLAKRRRDSKKASGSPAALHGELTPERQAIYETAMNDERDPGKILAVAVAFEAAGLDEQGNMLRKRAVLRSLPKDIKAARKDVFKRAMKSGNKQAILGVAASFQREGATGAAEALRVYASGLPDEQKAG